MSLVKEFFNKRLFISCMVFSIPVSALFTWRYVHLREIAFFSGQAAKIYLVFVVADFLVFLLMFFILFWLSKRQQRQDD